MNILKRNIPLGSTPFKVYTASPTGVFSLIWNLSKSFPGCKNGLCEGCLSGLLKSGSGGLEKAKKFDQK